MEIGFSLFFDFFFFINGPLCVLFGRFLCLILVILGDFFVIFLCYHIGWGRKMLSRLFAASVKKQLRMFYGAELCLGRRKCWEWSKKKKANSQLAFPSFFVFSRYFGFGGLRLPLASEKKGGEARRGGWVIGKRARSFDFPFHDSNVKLALWSGVLFSSARAFSPQAEMLRTKFSSTRSHAPPPNHKHGKVSQDWH